MDRPDRAPQGVAGQRPALEQVCQHLQVVAGAALVVHAVGKDLLIHFAGEQPLRLIAPALGLGAGEVMPPPEQGLGVLDEVVAADVQFEVPLEEPQLHGERGMHPGQGLG